MTKELAIQILRSEVLGTNEQTHEAVFMAIKALKNEQKRGKWICVDDEDYAGGGYTMCLACKQRLSFGGYNLLDEENYCPNCGARMGDDWEEPEINPCRGCGDYDGRGGCKSHGGCGAERSEE